MHPVVPVADNTEPTSHGNSLALCLWSASLRAYEDPIYDHGHLLRSNEAVQ
jgi:hypothetical protein